MGKRTSKIHQPRHSKVTQLDFQLGRHLTMQFKGHNRPIGKTHLLPNTSLKLKRIRREWRIFSYQTGWFLGKHISYMDGSYRSRCGKCPKTLPASNSTPTITTEKTAEISRDLRMLAIFQVSETGGWHLDTTICGTWASRHSNCS